MKRMKYIIYLLLPFLLVMQSCVKDEANIFDDTAAARGQKAVETYRALLIGAENGWYLDYYPELDYSIGGYAMYWKFTADGQVSVQCEVKTNLPANTADISEFDVFMEQGPILSFNSYNKVLHYFSEPSSADVNGQEGDYEFIIMNADPDQILLKGKKHGTKMLLRRNVANLNPDTHLAEIAAMALQAADALTLHLIVNSDDTIGVVTVSKRTFTFQYNDNSEQETLPYAFTSDGIRMCNPFVVKGVTIENFQWNNDQLTYVCTDAGADVRLSAYFPADFQLRYGEFLGKWHVDYTVRINTTWSAARSRDIVEIVELERNVTFRMTCDKMFNFEGLILTFDPLKGTASIYPLSIADVKVSEVQYGLRQIILAVNRSSAYGTLNGPGGLIGAWNHDEAGERTITFVDNGRWGTYQGASVILRLYNVAGAYVKNYTENVDQKVVFENIVLTKIND
jgi:hypothetical protein